MKVFLVSSEMGLDIYEELGFLRALVTDSVLLVKICSI